MMAQLVCKMVPSENMNVGSQAFLSAMVATALAVTEFLDSILQLVSLNLWPIIKFVLGKKFIDRVGAEDVSQMYTSRQRSEPERTYLEDMSSLKLPPPSSSSDTFRLSALEGGLEFCLEVVAEVVRDDWRDWDFLETVLPLSKARLRKSSCISKKLMVR
jgi:hypothetical protein